jgi:hypothetical protein
VIRTDLGWVPRAPGVGDTDRFRREGTGDEYDDDDDDAPGVPSLLLVVVASCGGTAATAAAEEEEEEAPNPAARSSLI